MNYWTQVWIKKKKNLKLFKMNILHMVCHSIWLSASTWKFQVILIHCTILCECLSYCNPIQKYYKVPREVKSMTHFFETGCVSMMYTFFFFFFFLFLQDIFNKRQLRSPSTSPVYIVDPLSWRLGNGDSYDRHDKAAYDVYTCHDSQWVGRLNTA